MYSEKNEQCILLNKELSKYKEKELFENNKGE